MEDPFQLRRRIGRSHAIDRAHCVFSACEVLHDDPPLVSAAAAGVVRVTGLAVVPCGAKDNLAEIQDRKSVV